MPLGIIQPSLLPFTRQIEAKCIPHVSSNQSTALKLQNSFLTSCDIAFI
jgi:hypothetical protein